MLYYFLEIDRLVDVGLFPKLKLLESNLLAQVQKFFVLFFNDNQNVFVLTITHPDL